MSGATSPRESKPIRPFYFGASVPVCAVIMSYEGTQPYSLWQIWPHFLKENTMFSAKDTLYLSFGIEVVTTQPRNCQLRPTEHPVSRSLLSARPKNSSQICQAVRKHKTRVLNPVITSRLVGWSTRNYVLFKLFIKQPKPTNRHQQKHRKKKCGSPNTSAPGPVPPLAELAACISQAANQVHLFYIYLTHSFFIYLAHSFYIYLTCSFHIYLTKQTKTHWPVLPIQCLWFVQWGRRTRFTAASCPCMTKLCLFICICWLLPTQIGLSVMACTGETSHFLSLLPPQNIFQPSAQEWS